MSTVFERPSDLLAAVGVDLGTTDWLAITQERVDTFADATGDHQWIHVDPERAKDGPFGGTIAHGYLTLSLVNTFLPDLLEVRNVSMGVNYGTDRTRFPAPVPVGSRIRGRAELVRGRGGQGRCTGPGDGDGGDRGQATVRPAWSRRSAGSWTDGRRAAPRRTAGDPEGGPRGHPGGDGDPAAGRVRRARDPDVAPQLEAGVRRRHVGLPRWPGRPRGLPASTRPTT